MKNYGFICDAIFFTCTRAHLLLFKMAEVEIGQYGFGDRERLPSIVDFYLLNRRCRHCIDLLRKLVRTDLPQLVGVCAS